jgi:hypothetical protein
LAQRAKLDQYPEGLGLITIGFIELMSGGQPNRTDELLSADVVKKALDSQATRASSKETKPAVLISSPGAPIPRRRHWPSSTI